MNFIITGAAGFIGSHLAAKLVAENQRVIAIDNLSTGFRSNLDVIAANENLIFIQEDVQQTSAWELYAEPGDIIVHLAATVGVKKVFEDSHQTLMNNLDSTNAVLEVARTKGCKVFFSSTSEVYGQSDKSSLNETDALSVHTTDQGRSAYVISKLTNEMSCLNYNDQKSVPAIIGRFFNVVGENQKSDFGMVIPTFIDNAIEGRPLQIFNNGLQRRSFCNINDVIRGIMSLINEPTAWGQIFNIGNDTSITIKELAKYICDQCNSKSVIANTPMPPERAGKSEIFSRLPSLDKINHFVQWQPEISWKDSIDRMIREKQTALSFAK